MFRTRQRGAIGIMAAATLLLSLVCLALVVDTGRLYLEKRKLQRVADMSAMETAAQSGLCGVQSAGGVQAFAQASALKNGFPSDGTLVATLGDVNFDASSTHRRFSPGGQWKDSVRVVAGRTVVSSLILNVARVFGANVPATTTLSATAVARREALGALSAGSGLLRLDSSNAPLLNALLGGLLGTSLSLDVVTYKGIAGANISLLSLGQQLKAAGVSLDLGSVDSLLGANVSVAQLLTAMVNAADASQVAGVNTALLRSSLASISVPTANLTLGQVLSVVAPASARDSAMAADVNLMDLLMATALVANKNHGLTLDVTSLSGLSGVLGKVTLGLTVISPPQIAIGYPGKDSNGQWRTKATSVQVAVSAKADIDLLNLHLVVAHVNLGATVAQGYAALDSIQCGGVGRPVTVNVQAQPGVAALNLTASVEVFKTGVGVGDDYLLDAKVTSGSGSVALAVPGEQPLTFQVASPSDLPSAVQTVQSPLGASLGAGLNTLSSGLKVSVTPNSQGLLCQAPLIGWLLCPLGKLVDGVLGLVVSSFSQLESILTSALASIVTTLGNTLIDPLLKLLGIQTGILDVRLIDVQTAGARLLI
ncbi:pilus assembly protein TadG-related protein [Pseudomonas knackmussii]|uniref:pilus assembly protein TadG-related protein n=1 Tax=Pseudomonas knackmussii TaxID=65741 RepID=UPI003BEC459D